MRLNQSKRTRIGLWTLWFPRWREVAWLAEKIINPTSRLMMEITIYRDIFPRMGRGGGGGGGGGSCGSKGSNFPDTKQQLGPPGGTCPLIPDWYENWGPSSPTDRGGGEWCHRSTYSIHFTHGVMSYLGLHDVSGYLKYRKQGQTMHASALISK
jgi:hypothetical protein